MKKKIVISIVLFILIFSLFVLSKNSNKKSIIYTSQETELEESYNWAFKNQITSKKSLEEANLDWRLTRVEMAKMISNFSKTILRNMPDTSRKCAFDDIEGIEPVLKLSVMQACQFWLMWQNTNRFRPLDSVTRAEFWSILSRALFWETYQGGEPYYEKSLQVLNKLWIIKDISDPNLEEKRGWVLMMLKRSEEYSKLNLKEIEKLIDKDHDVEDVALNDWNKMPVIGLWTWTLNNDQAESMVYEALKDGYRLIDTAKYYTNEEGVGRGLKKAIDEWIVTREDVFITTKILPSSYYDIDAAIDESLENLWVEYVDLFLVHQPWEKDKETYEALERWVKSWKIRSVWISNYYSRESFDEMVKNMDIKPAVLQNENHIYYQNIELKDYIKKYWTVLESWYPLWGRWHTEESFSHPIIQKLAEKYKKSSAQIILRWQIQDWYIAIPWSSNPEHIKENYSIFDFELTEQEMKLIRMINENKRYENR